MPEFTTNDPSTATHIEPAATACENCGLPYRPPDEKALTVADVLKRDDACLQAGEYRLFWTGDTVTGFWVISHTKRYAARARIVFQCADESAACAEFLRLTGGER